MMRSLLPSEEFQLLELLACVASVKFSCVLITSRFPWWPSSEESVCQCREKGLDPWSRKVLHVMEQLSLCPTTTEPVPWRPAP